MRPAVSLINGVGHARQRRWRVMFAILLLAIVIWNIGRDMAYLNTIPIDDIFAYNCYARAFWQGTHATVVAPETRQCAARSFQFWTAPPRQFYSLPREYPPPALAVFSIPLLMPWFSYRTAYMWWMAILVVGATFVLAWRGPPEAALALPLYALVCGWATTLARYDLAPGLCALAALVLAQRGQDRWATALLAFGTLLKAFPVLLFPLLLIQRRRAEGRWRIDLIVLFTGLTILGFVPAIITNPYGFWGPLTWNFGRPLQIESLPGSLLWLTSKVGAATKIVLTYHSLNVIGTFQGLFSTGFSVLLLGGLVLTYWRAWRGRDSLARSFLLIILVTLVTSKLLSPQYLLWLLPLAAFIEGVRLRWIAVSILTATIYPHAYQLSTNMVSLPTYPLFMQSILARNAILLILTLVYLTGAGDTGLARARWPAQSLWHIVWERNKPLAIRAIARAMLPR